MEHRRANLDDLPAILDICAQAKAFLRACGVDQWQDGYPDETDFRQDIERGECHVFEDAGRIVAMVTLSTREEPVYRDIRGAWRSDGPYAVMHRSAVCDDYRGRGVAHGFVELCQALCAAHGLHSIRVDTHAHNRPMRALLERSGFVLCGEVYYVYSPGKVNARVAYEKLL